MHSSPNHCSNDLSLLRSKAEGGRVKDSEGREEGKEERAGAKRSKGEKEGGEKGGRKGKE